MKILIFGDELAKRTDLIEWLSKNHEIIVENSQAGVFVALLEATEQIDLVLFDDDACSNFDSTLLFAKKMKDDFADVATIMVSAAGTALHEYERILEEVELFDFIPHYDLSHRTEFSVLGFQLVRVKQFRKKIKNIKNSLIEALEDTRQQLADTQGRAFDFDQPTCQDWVRIIANERRTYNIEKDLFKRFFLNGLNVKDERLQSVLEKIDTLFLGQEANTQSFVKLALEAAQNSGNLLIYGKNPGEISNLANTIHFFKTLNFPTAFFEIDCENQSIENLELDLFGEYDNKNFKFLTKNGLARIGKMSQAENGVLFLNNVHKLPLKVQGQIVEAMTNGYYLPKHGMLKEHRIEIDNVEIYLGSTKDLSAMVQKGLINIKFFSMVGPEASIKIPQLAERGSDVQMLISHLIVKFNPTLALDSSAVAYLASREWEFGLQSLELFMKSYLPKAVENQMLFFTEADIQRHYENFARNVKSTDNSSDAELFADPKVIKTTIKEFDLIEAACEGFFENQETITTKEVDRLIDAYQKQNTAKKKIASQLTKTFGQTNGKINTKRVAAKHILVSTDYAHQWPKLRKVALFIELVKEPVTLFQQKQDMVQNLFELVKK